MPCSPGMTQCARSCRHRSFVLDYRAERQRQEQVAEDASLGYETELQEYLSEHRLVTFHDWLIHTRQPDVGTPEYGD